MPTYEYECTNCHHVIEVFQSITAKPLKRVKGGCPRCRKNAPVTRLIGTGAALLFKGDGFYQTDYRSEDYKKSAKAETETSSDSKKESKSDVKSDAKADAKTGEGSSDKGKGHGKAATTPVEKPGKTKGSKSKPVKAI